MLACSSSSKKVVDLLTITSSEKQACYAIFVLWLESNPFEFCLKKIRSMQVRIGGFQVDDSSRITLAEFFLFFGVHHFCFAKEIPAIYKSHFLISVDPSVLFHAHSLLCPDTVRANELRLIILRA